jgi:hypothetical protein
MAGNSDPVKAYGKDVELLVGTVTGNGAADGVVATGSPSISSLAHAGVTGKYTLTLKERGATMLGVHLSVQGATSAAEAKVARAVSINQAAKTVTVEVCDLVSPALADLDSTDTLHVLVAVGRTANV